MLKIYDLKTEYKRNPDCVDTLSPRFSWKLESDRQNVMQKSYRITAYSGEREIWDSGEVESSQSQRILYRGEPLKSRQAVVWKACVTVMDDGGRCEAAMSQNAEFRMGLLNREDWQAGWIEPEPMQCPEAEQEIAISIGAEKAATESLNEWDRPSPYLRREFMVRSGLKEARIYQTAHGLYETWMNGKLCTEDKFKPGLTSYYYRMQYHASDITGLLKEGGNCWSVMLGDGWWRGTTGGSVRNNFGFHLHYLGQIELYYEDGTTETIGTDESFRASTGGLLASDMLMGDIFDARLEPEGWKEPGYDDSGWRTVRTIGGSCAGGYEEKAVSVNERKEAETGDQAEQGKGTEDQKRLIPGIESKATEHVDAELIASRSVPVREMEHFEPKFFQDAAGKLVLDFGQNIAGYVKIRLRNTRKGQRIRLVHGEDINAEGCFSVEHINKPVMPVPRFQEIVYICKGAAQECYTPLFSVFGFRYLLVEGYVGIANSSSCDKGANNSIGEKGLNKAENSMQENSMQKNSIQRNSLAEKDSVIKSDRADSTVKECSVNRGHSMKEIFFTDEIRAEDFVAVAVYSDMEETGDFTCSHPLINKLVQNSRWSQKGNFLDVAVDCPTRERNAWTGDNQIYVRTASYFMNVYPFYEKWLQDQAIEQYASGKVGITFPSTSSVHNPQALAEAQKTNPTFALAGPAGNGNIGEDCAGWGDSAAWLPYSIYLSYGDGQILRNQYETARKWVDYMLCCAREHNPLYEEELQYHTYTDGELDADYIYDTRMHYGEWQEPIAAEPLPEGADLAAVFARMVKEGKPKVATAYMCRSAENVSMMAGKLGLVADEEKYRKIAEKIRRVYDRYFIGGDGRIEPGHQAAYVRALAFQLCSEEKRPMVQAQLVKEIEANGYKLNTGFLSTPFLLPVLVDMGRTDLAYRILEQTEKPGWLHPITLGATTIPESWNGFDAHEASLNHYSYGAVCEFLFGYVGGIRPIWEKSGYEEFIVQPVPGGSLSFARAEYESQYGRIVSSWRMEDERIVFDILIPANTVALVILPDGSRRRVGSGRYQYAIRGRRPGFRFEPAKERFKAPLLFFQ